MKKDDMFESMLRRPRQLGPTSHRVSLLASVLGATALATIAACATGADPSPTGASDTELVRVVVNGPSVGATAREVTSAGGSIRAEVELINGVVAELPRDADLPSGYTIVPDRSVSFASATATDDPHHALVRETIGLAPTGSEGAGVTVALVDTGVADVPDLAGRLEHIDVTGTGIGDEYGHGTYLAGLLAGSGDSSDGRFQGVAPHARVLDVKVADQRGRTSLGLVLAGLQEVWDTADQFGTKVVNLSLASGSPMPYQVDPLNQALRRLWHRGLTVVVASGNTGPASGTVSSPGNDPLLLTAGSLDDAFTAVRSDDTIAEFSGRGPTDQGVSKPDLVAPGAYAVGLRSPGSHVDLTFPDARVGQSYIRGSGSSASAAITSGAVATVLSSHSDLRPAQVKYLMTTTAYQQDHLRFEDGSGAGGLDLRAALDMADAPRIRRFTGAASDVPGSRAQWQSIATSVRNGDRSGAAKAWRALSPEARSWVARAWVQLDPTARAWVARAWVAAWSEDDETTPEGWAARAWIARAWVGDEWAARAWVGNDWAARAWVGNDWAARAWISDVWEARSWVADWR